MNIRQMLNDALGREFRIVLPDTGSCVTENGLCAVWSYLWDKMQMLEWRDLWNNTINGAYSATIGAIGAELVTPQGRFAKRLSSYLYREYGVKLSDAILSGIGNIASENRTLSGEYIVRFVCDLDHLWRHGDYGDYGSCYWHSNSAAPGSIFAASGAGITVHTIENSRIGRAWCVCAPRGGLAIWNWYNNDRYDSKWSMAALGHLLTSGNGSPFAGLIANRQRFDNDGPGGGTIYINCAGLYLSTDGDRSVHSIDLGIDVIDCYICSDCGCAVSDDDYYELDGEIYCESCYPGEYCDMCGEDHHRDTMTWIENEDRAVCEHCYERYYTRCVECNEHIRQDDSVSLRIHTRFGTRYETYCPECNPGVSCVECGDHMHPDDATVVGNDYVCDYCLDRRYVKCNDCGGYVRETESIVLAEIDHCADCAENHGCIRCEIGHRDIDIGNGDMVCADCYHSDYTLVNCGVSLYQTAMILPTPVDTA